MLGLLVIQKVQKYQTGNQERRNDSAKDYGEKPDHHDTERKKKLGHREHERQVGRL